MRGIQRIDTEPERILDNIAATTIEVEDQPPILRAREVANPGGLTTKVFGVLFAIAFIAAGIFFGTMPTQETLAENWWLRLLLGCGMLAIAGVILWSNFSRTTKVAQFSLDARKQQLSYGDYHLSGEYEQKGTVPFADIKQFFAGSKAGVRDNPIGYTALYIDAKCGPKNGALLSGVVQHLEPAAGRANAILAEPPFDDGSSAIGTTQRRTGFGRRGV